MSREIDNFVKVIDEYAKDKETEKQLKKQLETKNAFIKKKLDELGKDCYETETNKATLTYQNKISMDEEKVIEIIKDNISAARRKGVIKTKEYVDYDVLETLIYNGVIAAEKLEPAQSTKVTVALNVKPIKKEKVDE